MKKLIVIGMLMLPGTVFAEEDCKVVEFPEHFEVTCTGDAKPVPISKQSLAPALMQAPPQSQATEQQSTAAPQTDTAPAAQDADAAKAAAPAMSAAATKPGRQGRPNSAAMNAAIEARRKLIQDMRPKDQPAVQ